MPKYKVWRITTYEQEQDVTALNETDAVEQARLHNAWLAPMDQEEKYEAQWIGNGYYE